MASTSRGGIGQFDALSDMTVFSDFLHGHAFEHKKPFTAIAEMIDNAYDADAKNLKIYKREISGETCLVFLDDGCGIEGEDLHESLSLGSSMKYSVKRKRVGQFGGGLKAGSMRLGEDALVFTKREENRSIGFLSQTFLKKAGLKGVKIPKLLYKGPDMKRKSDPESEASCLAILKYSPFDNEDKLKKEFEQIPKSGSQIVISNLKRLSDDSVELDLFVTDPNDILYPNCEKKHLKHKYSLREYCSILYLKPKMKIYLNEMDVEKVSVYSFLSDKEDYSYNPKYKKGTGKNVVYFGITEKKYLFGMMLYHSNRLIKILELPCQGKERGKTVLGVATVDYLDPSKNKGDFFRDKEIGPAKRFYNDKMKAYLKQREGNASAERSVENVKEKSKEEMSRKGGDEGARQIIISDSDSDMEVGDNGNEDQGAVSSQSKGFGMINLAESSSTSDDETPSSESVDQPGEDDKTPTCIGQQRSTKQSGSAEPRALAALAISREPASSRKSATSRESTTSRESATPRESAKRGQAASIKKRRSYRELEIELSEMKMNVIKLLEFLNPGVDLRRIKDKEKLIKDMVVELEKDQASQGESTNAAE